MLEPMKKTYLSALARARRLRRRRLQSVAMSVLAYLFIATLLALPAVAAVQGDLSDPAAATPSEQSVEKDEETEPTTVEEPAPEPPATEPAPEPKPEPDATTENTEPVEKDEPSEPSEPSEDATKPTDDEGQTGDSSPQDPSDDAAVTETTSEDEVEKAPAATTTSESETPSDAGPTSNEADADDESAGNAVAQAESEPVTSGTCGFGVQWSYANGTLTISSDGSLNGQMYDYLNSTRLSPWHELNDSITSIVVEEGVTRIGDYAFYACSATSVTLPSSLREIGSSAFYRCSVRSLEIPEGVTTIEADAFDSSSIRELSLPASLTDAGIGYALRGMMRLERLTVRGSFSKTLLIPATRLKELVWDTDEAPIPNVSGATSFTLTIGPNASSGVDELISTLLTRGMTDLEFTGPNVIELPDLTASGLPAPLGQLEAGTYCVDDQGVLYQLADGAATLVCVPDGIATYTVPAQVAATRGGAPTVPVTGVGSGALYRAQELTTLTFDDPEQVTSIAPYAFAYAGKLSSINGKTSAEHAAASFTGVTTPLGFGTFEGTALKGADGFADAPLKSNYTVEDNGLKVQVSWKGDSTLHEQDGGEVAQRYTGESASVVLAISNTDQSATDDGTVVRVYVQFSNDEGGEGSYLIGENSVVDESGKVLYTFTKTKMAPGIYCYELPRPTVGETNTLTLPLSYPSPSSGGGTTSVWIDTVPPADKDDHTIPQPQNYLRASWDTRRDDFAVSKTTYGTAHLDMTDDGTASIDATFQISFSRDTENSLEGIGKDHLQSVTFTDVVELPEYMSISDEVSQAIEDGNYLINELNGRTCYVELLDGTRILDLSSFDGDSIDTLRLALNDAGQLTITWTVVNDTPQTELSIGSRQIKFCAGMLQVDGDQVPQGAEEIGFTNHVSAALNYSYSDPVTVESQAACSVDVEQARLEISKTYTYESTDYTRAYGEPITYEITVKNPTLFPYEADGHYVTDDLDDALYLSPAALQEMFDAARVSRDTTDGVPYRLTITIQHALLGNPIETASVTDMNGNETTTRLQTSETGPAYIFTDSPLSDNYVSKDATLTLTGDDSGSITVVVSYGSDEKTATVAAGQSLQDALDELGFVVGEQTCYDVRADFGKSDQDQKAHFTAGRELVIKVPATVKDSLMMLPHDEEWYHPESEVRFDNYARLYTPDEKLYSSGHSFDTTFVREFAVNKSSSIDDADTTAEGFLDPGSFIDYEVDITDSSEATYTGLPVVDRMVGNQALLVPTQGNEGLSAFDTTTYQGATYYVLDDACELHRVSVSGKIADTLRVTTNADGTLTTTIVWYFPAGQESQSATFSYSSIVLEPSESASETIVNNCTWLGNRQGQRLYDWIYKGASRIAFQKRIVDEVGDGSSAGETFSTLSDGCAVVYRLMLRTKSGEAELSGNRIYDALPVTLDTVPWNRGANVSITYGDEREVDNPDSWSIVEDSETGGQRIAWGDDFKIHLTTEPSYIYVTLTFPAGESWQDYVDAYGAQSIENSFHVDEYESTVLHAVGEAAEASIQKGVYEQHTENSGSSSTFWVTPTRTVYNNSTDAIRRIVTYYVSIYNGGRTRLYLTEVQDLFPQGFTYQSYSPKVITDPSELQILNGTESATLMKAYVSEGSRYPGRLQTFTFSGDVSEEGYIHWDEERHQWYLMPGEALAFTYELRVGWYDETEDVAINQVVMPFDDYNRSGLNVAASQTTVGDVTGMEGAEQNNGSCGTLTNGQAADAGFTWEEGETEWLTSQVALRRSTVLPGITKQLTAATDGAGQTDQNPAAAHPNDTLTWTATLENDGEGQLNEYVFSDTMQAPYRFTGLIEFHLYNENGYEVAQTDADAQHPLEIVRSGDEVNVVGHNGESHSLKYGVPQRVYTPLNRRSNSSWSSSGYYLTLCLEKDSLGQETLSIHVEPSLSSILAIPEGGRLEVSVRTENKSGQTSAGTYTNRVYLTPVNATWEPGEPDHGNKIDEFETPFTDEALPTVTNSAIVNTYIDYYTTSVKRVTQTSNPGNTAASSNVDDNRIVLPEAGDHFTYELSVTNPNDTAMDKIVLIDNLPETGDHATFNEDDPRLSEFKVAFANDPKVTLELVNANGTKKPISQGDYTVQYSTKTEFTEEDWDGSTSEGWTDMPQSDSRSIRVVWGEDTDPDTDGTVWPNSSLVLSFEAQVAGGEDPEAGAVAWNNFGYSYSMVDSDADLQASPSVVGVQVPDVPAIQKRSVDALGADSPVAADTTFSFMIYTGEPVTGEWSTEEELIALLEEGNRSYHEASVTVPAGEALSDVVDLAFEGWTWTHGDAYTIVELPGDGDDFAFGGMSGSTGSASGNAYTFTYDFAHKEIVTAENRYLSWSIELTKVDGDHAEDDEPVVLPGAVFARYSPNEGDKLGAVPDEYTDLDIELTYTDEDDVTWYLADVKTTADDGTISWDDLREDEYLLLEVKAPDGYNLPEDPAYVVSATSAVGGVAPVTRENFPGYELPATGGSGRTPWTVAGSLLVATCLIHLFRSRQGGKEGRSSASEMQ